MKLHGILIGALALAACTQDNDAQSNPAEDAAISTDAAAADTALPDAAPVDAQVVDAAPLPPDAEPADMPVVEPPCTAACARFVDCTLELCGGFSEGDRGSLAAGCAASCEANPAFATVVNGAATCQTVVDFGRDANPEYAAACRPPEEPLVPDGSECPYPCVGEEVCFQGQCVRPDGTCDTDYHCRLTETCAGGQCVTAQFAECRNESDCTGEGQTCRSFSQNPLDPGNCFVGCQADEDCPQSEECNVEAGNICYYAFCGGSSANGRTYGECRVGPWSGTCYPLAEGNSGAQGTEGVCLEADGEVPIGGPCDAQAEGRTPEDRALQCAPGGLCFGDPDDPRQPGAPLDGQGECSLLCDPRAPRCGEGQACIDFTSPDDPGTDFDETTYVGVCVQAECDVVMPGGCPEGEGCRPYAISTTAGYCGPAGALASQAACATSDDCAGNAICGNNGVVEQACLPMCDPGAEAGCVVGETCYAEAGWAVGFCLPAQ